MGGDLRVKQLPNYLSQTKGVQPLDLGIPSMFSEEVDQDHFGVILKANKLRLHTNSVTK